ncbi:transmembrane amino acid transporter protein-domain-containing protein [Cunninghamella echinulata]|nr:transmembrane amino acid transporter protein-domain-containing protein [Cunninghamella echinulata]
MDRAAVDTEASNKVECINNYQEDDIEKISVQEDHGRGNGSFVTAYFNIVCAVAGTGTLGLPAAFAKGGWLGILILFLSYGMAVYSGIVLIRCLYHKPGQRLSDFKAMGTAAFGTVGYLVASFLHYLYLFGCPALYLVLAAGNITQLLEGTSGALTRPIWTIIVGLFLLVPLLLLKTLREVTAVSAIGAICTMMAVFIILILSPLDRNNHPDRVVHHDPVIWSGFPSALATIAFSFGGNNTYPHVEYALKRPQQWPLALVAGLSTCTILYFLTAVPAYWAYGSDSASPIYYSLPTGPGQLITIVVMTIHVIFAVPIYATSFSLEFETWTRATDDRLGKFGAWVARAVIRSCTMAILVLLAIFVPYFDDFMSLIGALANCGLVFLLPVLCYLKLTGVKNKPIYELAFCGLTVILGLIGLVIGTKDAIIALVADFEHAKK